MKVAVLLTGQPRHLEQGAWWFKNKIFPNSCGIDVDYFAYFWDNGDIDLGSKIQKTYSPVRYHIDNYDNVIDNFIDRVQSKNSELANWSNVPPKYKDSFLFGVDKNHISNYSKNIWGQYLCASKISTMLGNLSSYDIVIRTRSDVAFKNMDIRYWRDAFSNIYKNSIFDDKMFTPWLYIDSGIPLFADFAFISKPNVWHNFNKNIEENCIKLATTNKALWYELEVSEFDHAPHWIWNKLAMYSKTNMLSFSVVWPMPFDCKLFRYDDPVNNLNFEYINHQFDKYSIENPIKK
jgi:hypothetical protein